ncbi:hypothetical protein N7508_001111 [Penicillium antarcticum]|uniref:uncharacterized protein n=1 Tax=Penicillium antarcticum TaxID=416450 RepID=UPI002399808C|nr:uncharacterized protein N7508_001111 [Penicillium antarcticum]KAJ5316603.1 hypothetical protein N7508_001111 [Penicillium antarcticum]
MPPTTLRGGLPVVTIVMARMVDGTKDHGVRPFLGQLGNGNKICKGVESTSGPNHTKSPAWMFAYQSPPY